MAAPKENKNAEKWTEDESLNLMHTALLMSCQKDTTLDKEGKEIDADSYSFDFIGEICRELKTYKEQLTYLSNKFDSCKPIHRQILSNLEANCFYNSKKGNIKEATAIVNLKSNHNWTDRQQNETINKNIEIANLTDEEIEERLKQARRVG